MEIFDLPTKEGRIVASPGVEVNQRQQREYRLIGRQKRQPGHIMFSLNLRTGEIKQADIVEDGTVTYQGGLIKHRRISIEEHCIYRQALNRKNFIKKLIKEGILVPRRIYEQSRY